MKREWHEPSGSSRATGSSAAKVRRGLYARWFAWMMAHAAGTQEQLYGARKQTLFADLRERVGPEGTIVEIGAGAGPNAAYFPRGARWVAVEPNVHFHPRLREAAEQHGLRLEPVTGSAEALSLPDASADAVVSTLVLCSVADPAAALAEAKRVLRPGGRLYLVEHVAAPRGTLLRRMQRLFRAPWRWVGDGCRLDRETGFAVEAAGFRWVQRERFDGPAGLVRPHLMGIAEPG